MKPYSVDICIIEDDVAQRQYLVSRLQAQYSIIEAGDGRTGIDRVRSYRPRVVICDLLLPGIGGLDVCRQIRSDPSLSGTHIMLVSTCEDRETKHLALNIGADDLLTKPYDFEEFCARLRNGLRISRLQERLHFAALTDGLTGLWNHAHFRHLLDVEFSRTRRYGGQVSLLMIDLDHFKAINDTYGHEVGNHVLIAMSRHIRTLVRDTDVVARYGGEEFAVVCPRATLEEARALAERIRKSTPHEVKVPGHPETVVTASIGVVCSADTNVTAVPDLINIADQALYEAKRRGRNRVAASTDIRSGTEDVVQTKEVERLSRQVATLSLQAKELCLQSIWALVQALDARDQYTARHSKNTTYYSSALATAAGWPDNLIRSVANAAMLHDLGKIGIPDRILQKTGALSPNEASAVRRVPLITCKILEPLRVFENEVLIIRHLRERFDGSGFPHALSGNAIPLGSRLLAVAEAFDAMTSDRTHRQHATIPEAVARLRAAAGTQFDPQFVELLARLAEEQRPEWMNLIEQTLAESAAQAAAGLSTLLLPDAAGN